MNVAGAVAVRDRMSDKERSKKDGENPEKKAERGKENAADPRQSADRPDVKERREPDEYEQDLERDSKGDQAA